MNILIVHPSLPYSQGRSGSMRTFRLIQHLAPRHQIFFGGLASGVWGETEILAEAEQELSGLCRDFRIFPLPPVPARKRAWSYLFSPRPLLVDFAHSSGLKAYLRELIARNKIDLVHIEFTFMGQYIECIPPSYCPSILVDNELQLRSQIRAARTYGYFSPRGIRHLLQYFKYRRYEVSITSRFDKILTITKEEKEALLKVAPGLDIGLFPSLYESELFRVCGVEKEPFTMIFTGDAKKWFPNVDGAQWFCKHVLPRILEKVPRARLDLSGFNETGVEGRKILRTAPPDTVRLLGFCDKDKLPERLERHQVFVNPCINGGGMRGKLLEAMAMGLPAVSTSIGAEGNEAVPERDIRIADNPAEFAAKVIELFEKGELRQRMGESAHRFVESSYSDKVVFQNLENIYNELVEDYRSKNHLKRAK